MVEDARAVPEVEAGLTRSARAEIDPKFQELPMTTRRQFLKATAGGVMVGGLDASFGEKRAKSDRAAG